MIPEGEKSGANPAASDMLVQLRRTFLPNRIIVVVEEGEMLERHAGVIPLLKGKRALQGRTTAYVCEEGVCELPTQDATEFAGQIARIEQLEGLGR